MFNHLLSAFQLCSWDAGGKLACSDRWSNIVSSYRRISSCTQIVTHRLTTILTRISILLWLRCAIIARASREQGWTDSGLDSVFDSFVVVEAMLTTWTPIEGNVEAMREKLCGRSRAGGATREEPCGRSHVSTTLEALCGSHARRATQGGHAGGVMWVTTRPPHLRAMREALGSHAGLMQAFGTVNRVRHAGNMQTMRISPHTVVETIDFQCVFSQTVGNKFKDQEFMFFK